jgi:hypothetical protein
MIYTYSVDLPYQDPTLNRRAFYKLPKSILLAPYLATNPYFVDYTNAIDQVFDDTVEAKIDALVQIRNMWVTTKSLEAKSAQGEMLDFSDWGGPERATVVSQVNLLGVKLANAGVISEKSYRAIAKFLGSYWFEKGKASMLDFLNFCIGQNLTITKLWTKDYKVFYPEKDPRVGTAIYDSPQGEWYPTTHVRVNLPIDYLIDTITLAHFFDEISNYNLVFHIGTTYDLKIVTYDSHTQATLVVAGLANHAIFKIPSQQIEIQFNGIHYGQKFEPVVYTNLTAHSGFLIPTKLGISTLPSVYTIGIPNGPAAALSRRNLFRIPLEIKLT